MMEMGSEGEESIKVDFGNVIGDMEVLFIKIGKFGEELYFWGKIVYLGIC